MIFGPIRFFRGTFVATQHTFRPVDCSPHRRWIALIAALAMYWLTAGAILDAAELAVQQTQPDQLLVYIGTYTRGESQGIYVYRFNLKTSELKRAGVATGIDDPSFLAIHPNRKFLYAVSEVGEFNGISSGAVVAYSIDAASGQLQQLNRQASRGTGPCHLVVDRAGNNVLVANYGGGSVACLPIGEDGRLAEASSFIQHEGSSVNARRQAGPHAHSINLDPANGFAVVADLGLDKVLVYRFDSRHGKLVANQDFPSVPLQPGAGPRHFAFHPSGKFAYVINEMDSTVTCFAYDAGSGRLETRQTLSTLPDGYSGGNSTAEVQVHPAGKFLYGSNRGHNSIAVFAVDSQTGELTLVEHEPTQGEIPRNFGIDPTGNHLLAANQRTNSVVVFRIDEKTGGLTPTGHSITVPSPVCIKFF